MIPLYNKDEKKYIITDLKNVIKYLLKGYNLPTEKIEMEIKKNDEKHFNEDNIRKSKIDISKINYAIPLLNTNYNIITFVLKKNIVKSITKLDYKFPIQYLLQNTKNVEILNNYDIEILYETYSSLLYELINVELTKCVNYSSMIYNTDGVFFSKKILKMYSQNLGINENDIQKVCKLIKERTITNNYILQHSNYISENGGLYIVRYYSFQGDYYMNHYLRNLDKIQLKNKLLEDNIKQMWRLIKNAPNFDNDVIVFRTIGSDKHLSGLKVNDIYTISSFLSTTRKPFFENMDYNFGNVVLKIHIPKNIKGSALSIELYSHFIKESEIVIAPLTKMKLIKKGWEYKHPNPNMKIRETYEFKIVEVAKVYIEDVYYKPQEIQLIDFNALKITGNNMQQKIYNFKNEFVNDIMQFYSFIGKEKILFFVKSYDSTDVYKNYYFYNTPSGFSINYQKNGEIILLIEIGNNGELHINHHISKYHISEDNILPDDILLEFLTKIANSFNIKKIIIYPNIVSCNKIKCSENYDIYEYQMHRYNRDIYDYLKHNKIRFKLANTFLQDKIKKMPKNTVKQFMNLVDNDCCNINSFIDENKKFFKDNYYVINL